MKAIIGSHTEPCYKINVIIYEISTNQHVTQYHFIYTGVDMARLLVLCCYSRNINA